MDNAADSLRDRLSEETDEHEAQRTEEADALADELGLDRAEADEQLIELEDGSVIVNFNPTKSPNENPDFYENLAESIDDQVLLSLADDYLEFIEVDRQARKDRDEQYEEGIQRSGLGQPAPGGASFDGANKVTHPLMSEACIDFAASAIKEITPPTGIVKSNLKAEEDKRNRDRADRKAQFLNWQLDEQIQEYRDEMEAMMSQVPLGGSQFLKWYFNKDLQRPACEFIPVDRILLPPMGSSFYDAPRVTEIEEISYSKLRTRIDNGLYREIEGLYMSDAMPEVEKSAAEKANDMIEGLDTPSKNLDGIREIYHVYVWLELEDDKETKGKLAPYILTIDDLTSEVLALYRNWESGDPKLRKLDWLIEFPFIKWRGILGIGFPHLIGGLSAAATGALRGLLDSAHINNAATLIKLRQAGLSGQTENPEIGQVTEIEAPLGVDDVRKMFMAVPYNQPSQVLYNLLEWVTQAGKGVVSTSEEKISEANNQMPVGTANALLEQGAKVFSSIHARLHRAQARSIKVLCRLNYWYLDQMENDSGTKIEVRDFVENSDVRPVSDPHIYSETQRIAQAQTVMQIMASAKNPKMFDERAVYKRLLETLKIPNISEILPDPRGDVEANPALENVKMASGEKCAAYPDQDHLAHLINHFAFFLDPNYGGSPLLQSTLAPLLLQHVRQHLTMHYLQSMRNDVEVAMGEDIFDLHEEKPASILAQQALAMTAITVAQKGKGLFEGFDKHMKKLQEAAGKASESKQQQALMDNPDSAVLIKTAKMQNELDKQRLDNEYKTKYEELAVKVAELQAQIERDSKLDDNKNATAIALKAMDNQAKEDLEYIKAGIAMDQASMQSNLEQDTLALQAVQQAAAELRTHGLEMQKNDQQNKATADAAQQQVQAQQQATQQQQNHELTKLGAQQGAQAAQDFNQQQAAATSQANQLQAKQRETNSQLQAKEKAQQNDHNNALDLGILPMLAQQLGATPGVNPKNRVINNLLGQ